MIEQTLRQLETRIEQGGKLNDEEREELRHLLQQLRQEVSQLPQPDRDHVQQRVALFSQAAPEEERSSPGVMADELSSTVSSFEERHPKLVEVVNRISTMLSNMGI